MKVVLHIDRLVLDGLALGPGQPARVRAALETELARLLRAPASTAAGLSAAGAVPRLRTPDARVPGVATPEAIGTSVARALHRGLGERR